MYNFTEKDLTDFLNKNNLKIPSETSYGDGAYSMSIGDIVIYYGIGFRNKMNDRITNVVKEKYSQ
jgi:hypothetical protein